MSTPPLVVRDTRRVIEVTGADRIAFLDATLSQRMGDRAVGDAFGALWLDIHGATLAALDLVVAPNDRLLALVAEPHVAPVMDRLAMRTFLSDAQFRLLDDVVVAVRGEFDAVEPTMGRATFADAVVVVGRPDGVDVLGPLPDVETWLERQGLPRLTDELALLLDDEVRRGVPRAPFEIDGPQLPEEIGLLPTHVHLAKGCYPGQEAVARMWMLGRPRRRLVVVALDEGSPEVGDEAGAGRERWTVRRVTTRAPMHALVLGPAGAGVDDTVSGDGWRGRVVRVVGENLSQPGADPKVTRRRDRPAGQRGNRLPG